MTYNRIKGFEENMMEMKGRYRVRGVKYLTNRDYGTNSSVLPHTFLLCMTLTLNLMVSLSDSCMRG